MPRYINVTKATHGAVTITTVKSISFNHNVQRLASAGDGDTRTTFQAKGMEDVDGALSLEDPVQAQALMDAAAADLVFEGSEGNDLTKVVRVTIKGAQFFSNGGGGAHNAIHGNSLRFSGFATSGALVTTVAATIP